MSRTPQGQRASLDKQPHEVAAMFDGVAERYDLTNTVLSLRARTAPGAGPPGRRSGCGRASGCWTWARAPASRREELAQSGAYAVGADLSLGMLHAGKRARPEVPLLAGDALRLPFADASFDAVTISFALRNVNDTDAALRELARVTRPGGRLVVCEFSTPVNPAFRTVYLSYLMRSLPAVARTVSSNPEAYVYLAESIRAWPDAAGAGRRGSAAAGWGRVAWRNLTGGVVALHRAIRE